MINNILVDCEKMRHANTGFYYFCKNLASQIILQADHNEQEIYLYLPKKEWGSFNYYKNIITYNPLHKFYSAINKRIDLWHSTTQMNRLLPKSKKTKILLTIHDLNFLYERTNDIELINRKLKNIQKKIDKSEAIATISNYVKNDILNNLNIGNKHIEVIYNGCNILQRQTANTPIFQPKRQFLFAIGAVNSKKNFHVLPSLLKGNDYLLVISGVIDDAAYRQKILEEAIRYDALERVVFTGSISDNDKYWYFQNCLAFLFPSLAEGFGLPVIEAMYFGKPVFLSEKTSLPEIGGDSAFYFQDFDDLAMQEAFDKGMRNYENDSSIALNLKNQAKLFNWQKAAQEYLKLYQSLI